MEATNITGGTMFRNRILVRLMAYDETGETYTGLDLYRVVAVNVDPYLVIGDQHPRRVLRLTELDDYQIDTLRTLGVEVTMLQNEDAKVLAISAEELPPSEAPPSPS